MGIIKGSVGLTYSYIQVYLRFLSMRPSPSPSALFVLGSLQ